MHPLVSLVVLGFRNFDVTTRTCLDSLKTWIDDPEIEIIVIDNGSDDDSALKTAAWCSKNPKVKLLLSDINRGYSGGMNWGAAHACGQWLFLVNNDTIFPPYTLNALKQVIRNAPSDLAMIGPVTNSAGNGQRLWKPDATAMEWLKIGEWLNSNPTGQLMPTYRCDFFCIAIRHDVWNELGGLDLAFGLGYYEDFDFSLRLRQTGYQQKITEDVFIFHSGSATFRNNSAARQLINRNKKMLQRLHPNSHFEHTRQGNLEIILTYQKLKRGNQWTTELEARELLRVAALSEDAPRSIIKNWLWQRNIKKLLT